MFMILFVLHNPDQLSGLLDAWEQAGVGGVTVLASTGPGRIREQTGLRDDLPLIPSLSDLLAHEENFNRTLFTIVSTNELVEKIHDATVQIVGDLNQPNNGIMAVIPLSRVYGLIERAI